MSDEAYEILALKYATRDARRQDHFLNTQGLLNPNAPMPMDYFVWLIRNTTRTVLVDTGFSEPVGLRRQRVYLRSPAEALRKVDVEPDSIENVILTHMHYDHSGTLTSFPRAKVHLQEDELRWVTGSELFKRDAQHSFESEDVVSVVRALYEQRLRLHQGDWELAPGIQVYLIGGHTPGILVVTVNTSRGKVVLASDTTHYFENLETGAPFSTTYDATQVLVGFRKLQELAGSPRNIIPGHDPLVMQRYRPPSKQLEGIAAQLDEDPDY